MTTTDPRHTAKGATFTDLVLEVFRLNGRLLAEGDRLTGDLGLTSARWQVLGAIDGGPLPVAQIARNMGLTRQAVQRVANDLAANGFVAFAPNPDHRRAKLVGLTETGRAALNEVSRRQAAWANRIASAFDTGDMAAALEILRKLGRRMDAGDT